MSHPLGPLADNFTAYAVYATAQSEMRHAYALIDAGQYLAAAAEITSAAKAAEVLARRTELLDPERGRRWRKVALTRHRFAAHARARAAESHPLPDAA
ncbi:hypothetical protein [Amycolatopsis magusensis]|uniref:Uncharacterized protein n=1 Tax=Amycolatopsis magusensis TaxID=882444 RepID=A0ABS4PPF7_9PSEU|nr:hypothetical protein [Amycolatopsis magusensis]MBP2180713.1 hypothetical protein [Amycolatopsis magusensis]MDI5980166.1 hypothetical protein [Amycolatopsis magusensis]